MFGWQAAVGRLQVSHDGFNVPPSRGGTRCAALELSVVVQYAQHERLWGVNKRTVLALPESSRQRFFCVFVRWIAASVLKRSSLT